MSEITAQVQSYRESAISFRELRDFLFRHPFPTNEEPFSNEKDWEPGYVDGSWDEVSRLFHSGRLTAEEYDALSKDYDFAREVTPVTQEYSPDEMRDDHGKWTSSGAFHGGAHYAIMSHAEKAEFHHAISAQYAHAGRETLASAHHEKALEHDALRSEERRSDAMSHEELSRRHFAAYKVARAGGNKEPGRAYWRGLADEHHNLAEEHAAQAEIPHSFRLSDGDYWKGDAFYTHDVYGALDQSPRHLQNDARFLETSFPYAEPMQKRLDEEGASRLRAIAAALPPATQHAWGEVPPLVRLEALQSFDNHGPFRADPFALQQEREKTEAQVKDMRDLGEHLHHVSLESTDQTDLHILHGVVSGVEPIGNGGEMNATYVGTITHDGVEKRVIIQPILAQTMIEARPGIAAGHQPERSLAVDQIDRLMGGHAGVPRAVVRDIPGHGLSLVQEKKGTRTLDEVGGWPMIRDNGAAMEDVHRIALLDAVVGNTDRHAGNFMMNSGYVVPIDHGLALITDDPGHDDNYYNKDAMEETYQDELDKSDHQALVRLVVQEDTMRSIVNRLMTRGEKVSGTASDRVMRRVRWLQESRYIPGTFGEMQ